MRPVIKLSQAWLDRLGWSLAEAASFLELDLASAEPAGAGDACPRCPRHHADYESSVFEPDPATVTSEREKGRTYVRCVCGAIYWFAAVDVLSAPTEDARVRAASVNLPPVVVDEIAVTDEIAVVVAEESAPAEQQSPGPALPPGQTMDSTDVVLMAHRQRVSNPVYYDSPNSPAPWIWAAIEANRRVAVHAACLYNFRS